ncbi:MAG TPA: DUF3105 domain-containing protein [Candidatus Saccharimonadales bacterium]|nr:DUF3105 domain-containing protein [Candidatus Saccharimonadales bacterium]
MSRIPIIVWILIPTILIVGVGVWFFSRSAGMKPTTDQDKPDAVSTPVAGTVEYDIVGRNHVNPGTVVTTYNSNPPTSGPHWPAPAKNGIYDATQPDEQFVHNLEHGYIWISYRVAKPAEGTSEAVLGLSSDDITKLKELVKSDDWKIVMEPRDKNDSQIALAAWGRVLKMDSLDLDKASAFIKTYRNRAPEKTPD